MRGSAALLLLSSVLTGGIAVADPKPEDLLWSVHQCSQLKLSISAAADRLAPLGWSVVGPSLDEALALADGLFLFDTQYMRPRSQWQDLRRANVGPVLRTGDAGTSTEDGVVDRHGAGPRAYEVDRMVLRHSTDSGLLMFRQRITWSDDPDKPSALCVITGPSLDPDSIAPAMAFEARETQVSQDAVTLSYRELALTDDGTGKIKVYVLVTPQEGADWSDLEMYRVPPPNMWPALGALYATGPGAPTVTYKNADAASYVPGRGISGVN